MPQDPQGLCTFEGLRQIISAQYTMSHGITPGTAVIECAPQPDLPQLGGTLTFTFANVVLSFPDCRVNAHSIRRNSSGLIWALTLSDRRWKFNAGTGPNGPLSGVYNNRLDDDTLDPDRKRTAQQLAVLCLEAMGEKDYDVSQMPALTYPGVTWANENPAQMLAQLADIEGCRVVLRLDNTVLIARPGVGEQLPDPVRYQALENSLSINPPQRPDALLVACGRSRFQADFLLEAVGLEVDGSIRPINDLSYAPQVATPPGDPREFTGDWSHQSPPHFDNISKEIVGTPGAGVRPRDLAQETVWRWYRIQIDPPRPPPGQFFLTEGILLPGYGRIVDIRQLLPIEDEQVAVRLEMSGKVTNLPAHIYGEYYDGRDTLETTPPHTQYTKTFSIDKEHGIVKFADCVYRYGPMDADGVSFSRQEAILYLRVAVSVRDIDTFAWNRFRWALVYPGGQWGTGAKVLRHEEIVYASLPIYDYDAPEQALKFNDEFDNFVGPPTREELERLGPEAEKLPKGVVKILTNAPWVIREANYYLQAADLAYQTPAPQEITYAGLLPISPDGAIQQVSWSVSSSSGAVTRASRNNEFDFYTPPYRERRMHEDLRDGQIQWLKGIAARIVDQSQGAGQAP